MNKIVSTDFITDDVQRLVPVDATATTPKNAAVAKLMKAWEAKTTQRTAKGAGLTLMAVSLAACNDDSAADTDTDTDTDTTVVGQTFTLTAGVDAVEKSDVVAKLMKIWEAKAAKRAAKGAGLTLMAVSLAACNGDAAVVDEEEEEEEEEEEVVVTPVSLVLTTGQDILTSPNFTTAADTITATGATLNSNDVIIEPNAGDGDTLTVALTANFTATPTISGIENIIFNVTSFAGVSIALTNIANGVVTVNNLQAGGTAAATVTSAGNVTVVAGSGVTGTLTVGSVAAAATVVNGGNAGTVNVTGITNGGVSVITGSATTIISVDGTSATTNVATVSALGAVALDTNATQQVEVLNLSGNGGAVVFTLGAADAPETITFTGSQSVTLVATSVDVSAETVSDATTAGTTTLRLSAVTANTDLSSVSVDVMEVAGAITAGSVLTFAPGASATISTAQTNAFGLDISDGLAAHNTGAISINLGANVTSTVTVDATGNSDNINVLNLVANVAQTGLDVLAGTAAVNLSGSANVIVDTTATASALNASALTGTLSATASATLLTITGGAGNDTITGFAGATVLDGGAGTDTLVVVANNKLATISNFEILELVAAESDFDASQLSGKSFAVIGTANIGINDATSVNISTIDLSGLAFATATVDVLVDLTAIDTTVILSNQGFTYTGSAAIDTVIGSANADTITLGEGADTVTAGLGADTIILTETTAATDTIIMTTGGAIAADTVIGFAVGALNTGGDNVKIDLSDINAIVTDLNTADAAVAAADGVSVIAQVAIGAFDMGSVAAGVNILNIVGNYATAAALETALEVGGTSVLTVDGTLTAGDAFLVLYDDGANSYLASVTSTAGAADNATFASGDLTVTNLMIFSGVSDSATFLAANFDIIA